MDEPAAPGPLMTQEEAGANREQLPQGFVEILVEECKGCCMCMDACPQDSLRLSDDVNQKGLRYVQQVDSDPCSGCGLCYVQCPSSAITVYRLARPSRTRQK
jgi:2-oxoglutarate ferredoxin oxidoreductase subunit delta